MGVVAPDPFAAMDTRALEILRAAKRPCSQIVRTQLEGQPGWILYLNSLGKPMTAWVWEQGVRIESGFQAEPAEVPA